MENIFFAENLKHIRRAYGMSQTEFATKLGVPKKRYQSYEEGRGEPSLSQFFTFCCILKVPAENLLGSNMVEDFTHMAILQLSVKTNKISPPLPAAEP